MHPTAKGPDALLVRELVAALQANTAAATACLKLEAGLTGRSMALILPTISDVHGSESYPTGVYHTARRHVQCFNSIKQADGSSPAPLSTQALAVHCQLSYAVLCLLHHACRPWGTWLL
jgi:hypothetical protein